MSLSIETLWADIKVISSFRPRQPLDRLGQMSMTPNSGLDMFFMPVLNQETSVLAPPEGYCFKSPERYLITQVKMVIFGRSWTRLGQRSPALSSKEFSIYPHVFPVPPILALKAIPTVQWELFAAAATSPAQRVPCLQGEHTHVFK